MLLLNIFAKGYSSGNLWIYTIHWIWMHKGILINNYTHKTKISIVKQQTRNENMFFIFQFGLCLTEQFRIKSLAFAAGSVSLPVLGFWRLALPRISIKKFRRRSDDDNTPQIGRQWGPLCSSGRCSLESTCSRGSEISCCVKWINTYWQIKKWNKMHYAHPMY